MYYIIQLFYFGKALVDLFGDVREFTAEVGTGALSIRKPAVHRKVTRGITRKVKALDAVALADVNAELDKASHSDLANVPLAADFVVSDLDSYGAVIVWAIRGAPGAVLFLNVHTNATLRVDSVI